MKTTPKKLSKTRVEYRAELTISEVTKHFDEALERLSKNIKIAGFRPGKAPKELVRGQLDAAAVREEAYSVAVRDAWHEIVHQLETMPIQDPEVEVVDFTEGKSATLVFSFDVRPEITVKGADAIKLTKTKREGVSEKDVQNVLESLSKGHAQTVITLEKAAKGDRADITFEGSLNGVAKEKLSAKKFPVVLGEASVMPGFEKELLGVKKGDEKKFTVTFPADHYDEELAGKPVEFSLKVDEVYKIVLPKIDDDFGKKFGHDNLAELKAAIKKELETEREQEYEQQRKAEWLAAFEKCVSGEIPQSLIAGEVERSRTSWREFLAERNLKEDDWLKRRKTTLEQMNKDWEKAAQSSVRIGLGLAELAKQEGRELATNEEFQQYLTELIEKVK